MNRFGFKPKLRGFEGVKGLELTQKVAAELTWRKPWLSFFLPVQAVTDENGNFLPGAEGGEGEIVNGLIEYHFQVDPTKISPSHGNRLAAIRDRLTAAQQIIEKYAAANNLGNPNAPRQTRVTREQLPDGDLLAELYAEQDRAADERLVSCVMVTGEGRDSETHWDYVNETGESPKLTLAFLSLNPLVAEAMANSLQDFLDRSKKSLDAALSAKKVGNGSTGTTVLMQKASSAGSLGDSTALEASETNLVADTNPGGMSNSN